MSKQQEKRFQSVNQFEEVLENGGFVGIVQKIVEKVLIKVQGPFFLNPDRTGVHIGQKSMLWIWFQTT